MQEKQYITAAQMGMMIFPVMVATADLLVPATTARQAQQDMWMSPVIASLVGFLTIYLVFQLHKLFPDESIIQFSSRIVGTFLGKLCGLLILFDFLYCNGNIIRQYGEFIVGSFLLKTPVLVVVSSIVVLCAITVRAGVEVTTWVTGAFIKISVFYFALALGTAQWLRLEDYRPIILPLGLLLVVFSFWEAPNLSQLATNIQTIIGIQTTGCFTLIPLVLWIIAHLRSKKRIDPPNSMTPPSANE
ncbi:GerAB/ArcD/ProY family transporter [Brevibacillus nitrificans]|uniref:GerAB/ArcD/ProY family transporter n=1 Tax=Brevibacillus nitrificans TaxID=651560 RepID=UPI002862419D|nr:GerAB/ArcD/ProY family transporter [Brevibacillus nitrificans]MDR7319363.1 hypothetical protein [Brevibacillus nitrificans]